MPSLFGFVVASSSEWILFHSFESEAFCLNGYDAIRRRDIGSFSVFDSPRYWRHRALSRLKIRPKPAPSICVDSVEELLTSVALAYPILSVHRETPDKRVTYVGPIVTMAERTFTIEDANCYGQWTGPRRMRYDDVTRVCFDGGYLNASALSSRKFRRFDDTAVNRGLETRYKANAILASVGIPEYEGLKTAAKKGKAVSGPRKK